MENKNSNQKRTVGESFRNIEGRGLLLGGAAVLLIAAAAIVLHIFLSEEAKLNYKDAAALPSDAVTTDIGDTSGAEEGTGNNEGTDGSANPDSDGNTNGSAAGSGAGNSSGGDGQEGISAAGGSNSQDSDASQREGSDASSGTAGTGGSTASGEQEEELQTIEAEPILTRSVTITAVGDCTMGTDEHFSYDTSFNATYERVNDPAWFLENVQEVFANDDLTIVNLEGTFTTSTSRNDKTYAFKGDPEYVNILTEGSVEACNIANNHSNDYGRVSLEDTIRYVEEAGITVFGYEKSPVIEVNGIKIGLVGEMALFTEYDCEQDMLEQMEAVKEKGAELIIVTLHWGTEKEYYPDKVQQYLGHSAIDHGAHLVIGHHSHRLQGVEVYKGRTILYSLANFCFGGNRQPSDMDTMIYQQTFTLDENGVVEDQDYTIIPASISSHTDYNDYQPRILAGDEGDRVLKKIAELSEPFA